MIRRLALLVPLALFLGFVVLATLRLSQPGDRVIPSKMVGKPFPAMTLAPLDAAQPGLSQRDVAGGAPVLVNVFASWCVPCRVEAPQLERLAKAGVVIHGIAVRDAAEDARAFLEDYGNPFRRIGMDPASQAMLALGASGVPETYLVDGKGIIRRQWIGEIRADQVDEVLAAVEAAR